MKPIALLAVLALAACTDPQLGIGMSIGNGGVAVSPTLSGNLGGATVTVSG